MKNLNNQFTDYTQKELEKVNNYRQASLIALDIILGLPSPIGQVCGPLTSGGSSREENKKIFKATILKLQKDKKIIFNQLNFQPTLKRLFSQDNHSLEKKNLTLLEGFYAPIFESGWIENLYFIDKWKSSFGACWEHQKITELRLTSIYLPKGFVEQ